MLEAFLNIKTRQQIPTDIKAFFNTARASQVNVNTRKIIFEQRSELRVAKSLIIHVLSSSFNFSSLEFRNKRKATQQMSPRIANDSKLNQMRVYHEIVYAENVVSKVWFVRSFASQH